MVTHARAFTILAALSSCVMAHAAPMGTGFTYQGSLIDGDQPANGSYEFEFRLYETPAGAGPIAATWATQADVVDGLFTAWVDFGSEVLDGQARWLEVAVRPESDEYPPYQTLSPRTALKPAPYSVFAERAGTFELPFAGSNDSPETALAVASAGTGGSAGSFEITSGANPSPALRAATSGSGPAAFLDGRVGIGTSTPSDMLHISRPWNAVAARLETVRYQTIPPAQASAGPTGTAVVATGPAWANAQNMLQVDGLDASVPLSESGVGFDVDVSQTLELTDLGLAVPSGATITGIKVHFAGDGTATSCTGCGGYGDIRIEAEAKLVADGGLVSAPRSARFYTESNYGPDLDAGDQTDLWGAAWTPEMVNTPTFGVRFSVNLQLWRWHDTGWGGYEEICPNCDGSATALLDGVTVTIYYQPAPVTPIPVNWTMGIPADETRFVLAPTADLSNPVMTVLSSGKVGIGPNPMLNSGYKLSVDGTVHCAGLFESSSRRFKREIRSLENALEKVSRLQGVSYQWDAAHGGGPDVGFIAEEVAAVIPEIVSMEPDGVNATGIKYDRIGALAVEAIKEMHELVRKQDAQIQALQAEVAGLRRAP